MSTKYREFYSLGEGGKGVVRKVQNIDTHVL